MLILCLDLCLGLLRITEGDSSWHRAGQASTGIFIALVLIGLLLLASRHHMVMQVIGLLPSENELFAGAFAIVSGMPLIMEFGVLFDILIAVIVTGLLVTLIQRVLVRADTADRRRLQG
ncbi:hypothetical protein [Thermogemmatispora tikiterensis]|uniref:Hydrogenase n=1 Tax=Thermogemmatispora tikiterensis TaxID=1825093 RepID=A0A328VNY4_9CHLR|nr:hypothetical protein [Thermogemmatispora tikiterensis]RAQ95875.1 hypothetical protein A4R35_10035 [Thermogemmatispora tikiterensis]